MYAWYVVGVLMLANVSGFVDRQVMALLTDPIKRDLALSDTQMSWLLGLAFAVFYSVLGFPIGRLADRRSRRAIIAWGTAIWSVMCALCGMARNYSQLFLARVGVGVGEASLTPPAFSLIADYFTPRQLATAMSIFGIGTFLGSGIGYLIGGTVIGIAERARWSIPALGISRPWQVVFVLVGLPGLLIALLVLTVREPARRYSVSARAAELPIAETFAHIRRHLSAFSGQAFGFSIFSLVNYGTASWFPSFFIRAHGWSQTQIGFYMGGATMVFGTIGIVLGGRTADWLRKRGYEAANLHVGIVASIIALVAAFPLYLSSSFAVLIAGLIVTNIAAAFPWGASAAALQEMTPPSMRGQMSAIYLFLINIIGAAGPTAVALLTDYVFRDEALVGMSLLVVTIVGRVLSVATIAYGIPGYRRVVRELSPSAVTGEFAVTA
jgi:MFS family permease